MSIRTHFHPNGLADIHVDDQHLSRIDHVEVREIICQLLMFGGKALREEVGGWLQGKEFATVAAIIAPSRNAGQP